MYLNAALASGDIYVSGSYVKGNSGPYSGQNYYNLAGSGSTYHGATNGGAARINWTGSTFTVDAGFENHPVTYVIGSGSMAFAIGMKQIKRGFLSQVRRPPDHNLAKKLTRRFKGNAAETYFRFLTDPNIEPTNHGTEREIRHTVIDRRITQGTRGQAGMRWCERIWTTIATCKKQERNVFDFIHKSLRANWTDKKYPLFL